MKNTTVQAFILVIPVMALILVPYTLNMEI